MSRRVLVVDDDISIVQVVRDILMDEGYEVVTALDGREALRHVEERGFDLVILDMRMPVLDGWEFASRLRRSGGETPILVMTAAPDARRWAEEIEAAGYIAKPFDVDELVRAVQGIAGPASDGASGALEVRGALQESLREQVRRLAERLAAPRRPFSVFASRRRRAVSRRRGPATPQGGGASVA